MPAILTVLMLLTIVFLPRLMVLLSQKIPALKTLGTVFLCYASGLVLSFAFRAGGADITLASDVSSVLVCIAMPLILFSADLPSLKKVARPMIISFGMNVVAVVVIAVVFYFVLRGSIPDADKISGMLIGTYTGGTPNMFAIGSGLNADGERVLLLQTADMIGGGIYFLLLISALPRLLKKVLPGRKAPAAPAVSDAPPESGAKDFYIKEFSGEKHKIKPGRAFLYRLMMVGLAVLCVGVAMGAALLLPSKLGNTGFAKLGEHTAVIMLVVTTLGIALSFVKKVRLAPGSYSSGQYFILMFSVAMGLCFDVTALKSALPLFGMLLAVQFGTVLLHILMARLGHIGSKTMMITSTAGVFGPAFIIPVARALDDDSLVLPGILCGILGYALGNYLGIGVGTLLALAG